MLRCLAQKYGWIITIVLFVFFYGASSVSGELRRKYPCDPKFGYEGNYLEITTGSVASAKDIRVCFGSEVESEASTGKNWWEFWKIHSGNSGESKSKNAETCLRLAILPGRFQEGNGKWTTWQREVYVNREHTTFQFALCGSSKDDFIWEEFHKPLGVDSWDDLRLEALENNGVIIEKLRVVQNRVRILDNESNEEGHVGFLLQAKAENHAEIRLAERIRKSKLRRLGCLNLETGPPYCEGKVPGFENNKEIPPVIKSALLELGHSGSKKYHRTDNAYCSEFAFFVIEKSMQISDICSKNVPNPAREDINVKDMFRWFKTCKRLIAREDIKEKIKSGDFLSVDNMGHSTIFLGWADSEKRFFWEISGNNRCLPERETLYAPKNKANMVCIAKRNFSEHILAQDFGGVVEY